MNGKQIGRRVLFWLGVSGLFGLFVGCQGDLGQTAPMDTKLQAMAGCDDVAQHFRATMLREMNARIDKAIAALRPGEDSCDELLRGTDFTKSSSGPTQSAPAPAPNAGAAPPTESPGSTAGGASQVSGTNNQVAGVDEADFLKNDQKYIYIVTGNAFRIIQAWPASEAKVIATYPLDGTPKKLFVYNDRAVIYASLTKPSSEGSEAKRWSRFYRGSQQECTYGYNCTFQGDGNPTLITVLDITDRTAPRRIRQIKTSGSYLNSRRIGDAIFTVISSPGITFPRLETNVPVSYCGQRDAAYIQQVVAQYEALRARNTKIIEETEVADWLPMVEETIFEGDKAHKTSQPLAKCGRFFRASSTQGGEFTTLLAMHLREVRPAQATTIVSPPGAVYASGKALYMSVPTARQQGGPWYSGMDANEEASTIHKFSLFPAQAQATYAASGVVKGHVLNQFAMDEHSDHLRIATTTGRVPNPKVHSTLTVFAQRNDLLVQTGQVDGLGPKEDIRSVRFDGERAYIVTFKKTDPLFVLDLSNPKEPIVKAELKIPGFSTYMQMMDQDHLLSIGYDADDRGGFAYFQGVLLQIFNVADPSNPKLIHREVIGTRGSSSEALTNHLAFTYFAPKNLLAIPMTLCTGGSSSGSSYGTKMEFSGLMVFDVTAKDGFKIRGKVAHPTGKDINCSNWWTNASSQVKRSIIMDDYVFSISESLIKANHLDQLSTDVASISLP